MLYAISDQVLLSAVNLFISLVFIRYGEKSDFGAYMMYMSPVYLCIGMLNALILSPAMTVYPRIKDDIEKQAIMNTIKNAMVYFLIAMFILGWFFTTIYQSFSGDYSVLSIAFALGLLGSLSREGSRSLSYIQERTKSAFISDCIYAILLITGLIFLVLFMQVGCSYVFIIIGFCGLGLMLHELFKTNLFSFDKEIWIRELWPCARWAIPGVLITWLNLNSYSIAAGYFIDSKAVADINAARLFLMPVSLCIAAWSNIYRPKIVKYLSDNNMVKTKEIVNSSVIFVLIALPLYLGIIYIFYPYLSELMGGKYNDIVWLIFLWSVYFIFCSLRTIIMALLMTSADGYKSITKVGYITSFISVAMFLLFAKMGQEYVISVLIVIEFIQFIVLLNKQRNGNVKHD